MYGSGIVNADGSFTFGEPHYIVKGTPKLALGQTITIRFRVDGAGTLAPVDGTGKQANLRIMLWRHGDNLSCSGAYQSYRLWSAPVALNSGEGTLSAVIDPSQWTDCFGQHPSAAALADLLSQAYAVGYTFGGDFAGHGVKATGTVTFTLISFTIQ